MNLRVAMIIEHLKLPSKNERLWHLLIAEIKRYINLANYGNRDIRGGIDRFWLQGELRITAKQQIDFLVKLYQNQLPFSQRSMDIVKDIYS